MAGQANHFRLYAPEKIAYAIDRYTNEVNRLLGVMNTRLATHEFLAGHYSIADMACVGWVRLAERMGQEIATRDALEERDRGDVDKRDSDADDAEQDEGDRRRGHERQRHKWRSPQKKSDAEVCSVSPPPKACERQGTAEHASDPDGGGEDADA